MDDLDNLEDFKDIIFLTFDERIREYNIPRFEALFEILGFDRIMILATRWEYPNLNKLYNILVHQTEIKVLEIL